MRLKTKLVLAITTLVLLISGLLSLVYASRLIHSASSSPTTPTAWWQTRFCSPCAMLLRPDSRTKRSIQTIRRNCAILKPRRFRNNAALRAVIESVNRYSLTVYDINIATGTANFSFLSPSEFSLLKHADSSILNSRPL